MTDLTAESGRPHALYVAWGFPPSRSGGVYRALATANGLVAAGFDVTVITCERETFVRSTGVDDSLEGAVDPAIDVIRLPFHWEARDVDIRHWPEERARDPRGWLRGDFPDDSFGRWARPLTDAALALHARRPVDLVVVTANPSVDVVPALELHRRFGTPFVYDQRDAWTLDVYTEEEANTDDPRIAAYERELVDHGVETWFVNEPISAWHRERYPEAAERILTVPNGYDPAFAPAARLARSGRDTVTFGYIGTLTPKVPLAAFCDGWELARKRGGEMEGAVAEFWGYLGFYGTPEAAIGQVFDQRAGAETGIVHRGAVPKAEVRSVYDRFDVLLLALASGRFVTSGKVYEYMASGLPIVSVHDVAIDASRVMQDYPLWFPARSLEPEDVADALAAAARASVTATPEERAACVRFAERFERTTIMQPRLAALRDVVEAARA